MDTQTTTSTTTLPKEGITGAIPPETADLIREGLTELPVIGDAGALQHLMEESERVRKFKDILYEAESAEEQAGFIIYQLNFRKIPAEFGDVSAMIALLQELKKKYANNQAVLSNEKVKRLFDIIPEE